MHSVEFLDHVCRLHKALYGLKQALCAWYLKLRTFLVSLGFIASRADSLFIYSRDDTVIYFLVYVDDLIITGSDASSVDVIVCKLHAKFAIKDLGAHSLFCGIEVHPTSNSLLLSQQKYVTDLLSKHNKLDSKPISTPIAAGFRLTLHGRSSSFDATKFRQVVGGLQYLRMTHPDISFAVNKLSQFMHAPLEMHWGAVKRLLWYLNDTRDLGIRLLTDTPFTLHDFSDADWAGDPNDRCSTGAFIIFLGANPISWKSTKQHMIARSSTEAEYRVIAFAATEIQWIKSLLSDLLFPVTTPAVLFTDNLGATYLLANLVFDSRMKHLTINYHFVRDLVQASFRKTFLEMQRGFL
ncbi:hypothetical protein ZIOFF_028517 [Zingiber officinale]|uniref:Reverse transcriptase Ty1/copia-type domain-containing protein n=1 Tax=Zingiber officinale TaxID=94328 RepID=A0A8J5LF14_ZINOF|nr:hypothetical protein ZIOFF_028517 [Zingiber officinale]